MIEREPGYNPGDVEKAASRQVIPEDVLMRTDDQLPTGGADDHCLVHHFIRTHGRRPTDRELQALGDSAAGPPVPRPRRAAVSETLPGALRRELARLIQRL